MYYTFYISFASSLVLSIIIDIRMSYPLKAPVSTKGIYNLADLYNYIDLSGADPSVKENISTIKSHNTQVALPFNLNIEQFVSTFRNDKEISKIPLPERMYSMFNIPKPEVMSLNRFLFQSIKSCMSAGYNSEIRPNADSNIRPMPFISTITYYDLSGVECKLQSTINGNAV